MLKLSLRAGLATCLAALALAAPAQARTQPLTLGFSGTFSQPVILPADPQLGFTTDQLSGTGSPIGAFTAVYPHVLDFGALTFTGVAAFTAANGDSLVIHLGGTGSPVSPTVFAIAYSGTVLGGTGRYRGASGTVAGPGTVDLAALTVSATLTGTLVT